MKKLIAVTMLVLALTGCSSWNAAHHHNAPTAVNGKHSFAHWYWLQSPGSFQTIIYTCIGTEAIYETQDNSYPFDIVQEDPICGGTGHGYTSRGYATP